MCLLECKKVSLLGGVKSVLNYEIQSLFIEVGMLEKISKKRMGENPKKKKKRFG